MDEQTGHESPSYYKQLKYDGLFIDDYNGGRTVIEGQVAVSDDNVVGDDPDHGQGVAANDGNVVGEGEAELQGVVANDGNAVGEEENQLPRVEANYGNEGVPREGMDMLGIYHLVVECKGHNDKVIQVRLDGTVASIKRQIETLLGINVSQQTLFFNGKRLEDSNIIESIRGNIAFNPRIELVVEADKASGSGSASAGQPSSSSGALQTFAVGRGKPSIAIITQTSSGGDAQVPAARSASESDDATGSSPSDPEWEASPSELPSSDSDWEPSTSTSSSAEGLPSSEELGSSRNNSARPTRCSERLRKREGS